MIRLLKRLMEIKPESELGFEAYEVGSDNRELMRLMKLGLVEITLRTNRHTYWRVVDKKRIERMIKLEETKIKLPKTTPLFDSIIGHNTHKEIILRAIRSSEPIHLLLMGRPATAKTLFLLELTKIDGAEYVTPYITYVGMFDLLMANPKIVLIDQIDNIKDRNVYRLLIDLCEYGYITKTTAYETVRTKVNTKVIATANSIKRIPEALLSRFLILKFKEYSDSEYTRIARKLLSNFKIKDEVKDYIIKKTLKAKDIRNAVKLARICRTKKDVDRFLDVIVLER